MQKMNQNRYDNFIEEIQEEVPFCNIYVSEDRDMVSVSLNYISNTEQDYYFVDYNNKKEIIKDIVKNFNNDYDKRQFLDNYFEDFCDNLKKESKKYILENIKGMSDLKEKDIVMWSDYNRSRTYGNLKDLNNIKVFIELSILKGEHICLREFIESDFNDVNNKENIMNKYKTHCDEIITFIRQKIREIRREETKKLEKEIQEKDILESRIKMYLNDSIERKTTSFFKINVDLLKEGEGIYLEIKFNDLFKCIIHDRIKLKSEYKKYLDIFYDYESVIKTLSNEIDYYVEKINE